MSRCRIDLDWADGTYSFCLPLAQLEELQTLCDAGPMVILTRLEHGHWLAKDVEQTIRLGLIGGGLAASDALRLSKLYVSSGDKGTWAENVPVAAAILSAVIFGKRDEPVGKKRAARKSRARRAAPRESSTSGTSTPSAL